MVIPNDGRLTSYFLDQQTVKEPATHMLTWFAEHVLTLDPFSFNGQYYYLIGGMAMGSEMSPNNAFICWCHRRIICAKMLHKQHRSFTMQLPWPRGVHRLFSLHILSVNKNCYLLIYNYWRSTTTTYRCQCTTRTTMCTTTLSSSHVTSSRPL